MIARRVAANASVMVLSLGASGCGFTGLGSLPLPLTRGGDDGDLRVTVLLANSTNLVPNSDVMYQEVPVGSVRKIEFDDWRAKVTIGISKDAVIPADVRATVAQKSLLGAEYLQLATPDGESGQVAGTLADGAVLGLDRTGRYPETEEVLAAASLILNNGGLPQLRTITHELNAALSGRTGDIRALATDLTRFISGLEAQRDSIVGVMEQLDRLSGTVVSQRNEISSALDELPKGIDVLREERRRLVRALGSLDDLSGVAHRVVSEAEDGLATNLENLKPLTAQLSDHAKELGVAVDSLTFPFPSRTVPKVFFGDYMNMFFQLSLDVPEMSKTWASGIPLEAIVGQLLGVPMTAAGTSDPLAGNRSGTADQTSTRVTGPGPNVAERTPQRDVTKPIGPPSGGASSPGLGLDALIGSLLGGRS